LRHGTRSDAPGHGVRRWKKSRHPGTTTHVATVPRQKAAESSGTRATEPPSCHGKVKSRPRELIGDAIPPSSRGPNCGEGRRLGGTKPKILHPPRKTTFGGANRTGACWDHRAAIGLDKETAANMRPARRCTINYRDKHASSTRQFPRPTGAMLCPQSAPFIPPAFLRLGQKVQAMRS
jgi:hypothetical protein